MLTRTLVLLFFALTILVAQSRDCTALVAAQKESEIILSILSTGCGNGNPPLTYTAERFDWIAGRWTKVKTDSITGELLSNSMNQLVVIPVAKSEFDQELYRFTVASGDWYDDTMLLVRLGGGVSPFPLASRQAELSSLPTAVPASTTIKNMLRFQGHVSPQGKVQAILYQNLEDCTLRISSRDGFSPFLEIRQEGIVDVGRWGDPVEPKRKIYGLPWITMPWPSGFDTRLPVWAHTPRGEVKIYNPPQH